MSITRNGRTLFSPRLYNSVDAVATLRRISPTFRNQKPAAETSSPYESLDIASSSSSDEECDNILEPQLEININQCLSDLEVMIKNTRYMYSLILEIDIYCDALTNNLKNAAEMENANLANYHNWACTLNGIVSELNSIIKTVDNIPIHVAYINLARGKLVELQLSDSKEVLQHKLSYYLTLIHQFQAWQQNKAHTLEFDRSKAITLMRSGLATVENFKSKHMPKNPANNNMKTPRIITQQEAGDLEPEKLLRIESNNPPPVKKKL